MRQPLSARLVCRTIGHEARVVYDPKAGWPVAEVCVRCQAEWLMPPPKESMHQDRASVGQDCINLADCTEREHTFEWPCDFA